MGNLLFRALWSVLNIKKTSVRSFCFCQLTVSPGKEELRKCVNECLLSLKREHYCFLRIIVFFKVWYLVVRLKMSNRMNLSHLSVNPAMRQKVKKKKTSNKESKCKH